MMAAQFLALLVAASPAPGYSVPSSQTAPGRVQPGVERPFTIYLGLGLDAGGEELASVDLTDGSTQTLSANQGFFFSAGLGFLQARLTDDVSIDTLATIGFKGWDAGGSDGSFKYSAFPVEVIERVSFKSVRAGLGVSYLLAPRFSSTGVLSDFGDHELDASLGVVGQVEWVARRPGSFRGVSLGLRMVFQEMESVDGVGKIDANSLIGLTCGFEF